MRGARPKRISSATKRSIPKIRGRQRSGPGNVSSRRPPDLRRNERLIEVLNAAALEVQNTLTPEALFAAMSKVLRRVGIRCIVLLADSDPTSFVIRYTSFSRRVLTAAKDITGTDPVGYRIHIKRVREYRKAVRDRSAVFVEDASELLDRFLPKTAARTSGRVARIFNLNRSIVAPLVAEGRVFGLLSVHSGTLMPTDTTAINVFANQLAAAWRRNELFNEAQEEITHRRETEAHLIAEKDKFGSILDIAGVILVVLNKEGRIVLINRKGQDILGYGKKQLLGKNWFDTCLPRASRKEVKAVFGDLISGKGGLSEYVENKIIVRSGEERTIAWHNAVIRDAGGKITGTLSSGEDVTEQKKTERALVSSEKKFRTLVESIHDIVFTTDLQQRYTGVFGHTLSEPGIAVSAFIGKTVREAYGKEAAAVHEAAMARALKGKHVVYDWSIPGGEGSLYFQTSLSPLKDAEGRMTGLVGVGHDITVQKRNEQLIRLQRDLIRDLAGVSRLEDGLKLCLKTALDISGMDCGGIYLFDFGSGALRLAHHHGLTPEFIRVTSEFASGSTHVKLVSKGESIFTEHLRLAVPKDPVKKKQGLRAIAVIPIRHEGKVIGCLNIASHSKDEVPSFSRESLETLANEIGGSIAGLQMQEALEKSETRYRSLVDHAAIGVLSMDKEGKCTYANAFLSRMTGYSPEEVMGRHFTEFVDAGERARMMGAFRQNLVSPFPKGPVEIRLKHRNGRIFHVLSNLTVLKHQGGVISVNAILQDITERRLAEEALQEREKKFRAIVETTREWIWSIDLKGKHTYSNHEIENILGYSADEVLGNSALHLIHPEDRSKVRTLLSASSAKGEGWMGMVLRWRHKNGSYRYLESNALPVLDSGGVIAGYQGADRDITERKNVEEELHQSEMRFRDLIENTSDWIWEVDTHMRYVYASPKIIQLLGYKPDEVLGKTPFDFMSPGEASRVRSIMNEARKEPRPFHGLVNANVHRDGSLRVLESSGVPLCDPEGRFAGFRGVDRDITERKLSEDALKESESKYRSMVLAAPVGVGVVVNRVFTEVNDSVCAMTGYRREEMLGKSSLMVYPSEEEFQRVGKDKYDQIREKGVGHIETIWKRKDGEIRDIYLSSAPIVPNDLSKGTTFTALDITDRKRAEQSLRESETRYRALVENSLIGIGISRGDRILYANRALMHMYGYHDFNELAVKSLQEYLTPQSRAFFQEWRLRNARGEPVPMELELDILRKDGEVRSLRLNMTPITIGNEECVYSAFNDITERKQSQARLQRESSFNSAIIRSTMEGLAVAHAVPRHPFILFSVWNDRMQEISGYTMEEINQIGWYSAMYPDPRMQKKAAERVERILAGDDMHDEEWIITRSDGEERTVSMSTSRLDTGSGDIHALVMAQDVTERRRAEQALRESEKQYRTTIEYMGNAIHVMDEDRRFVLFNKAFQDWNRSLGLKTNVIGNTLFEVFPFLPESVGREYDDVFRSGQLLATQEMSIVNGRELFTETRKIPILKDNRVIQVVTVLTDITERKSAEKALIRSEELFRQLAENIHEVFWVRDFKTRRIEYVSHAFEDIWGRPCGSMYEDSELFMKTVHPDDVTKMQAADKVHRLTGVLDEQFRIIRPDRTIRWVRARTYPVKGATGEVFRTVGVAEDITDFKHAEESLEIQHRALIESSAALNAFINALPEPAMLIDTRYRIIVANSAMARSLGKSSTDMVGLDSTALFPPAAWESTRKAVDSVVQTGQEMHFEGVRDGRFYVNYVTPAFTPAGEVTRIAVFELDITDRIKAEETLKKSQDAFRLASLGTLAGGISHEINQPLTALKVKVDGMLYWGSENQALLHKNLVSNLKFISDEAEKIDLIIQHMRSLIKHEKREPEAVGVNGVIRKALTLVGQQMASHGIRLELDLDAQNPIVLAQVVSMEEVVVNLVSNAVQVLDTVDRDVKTVRISTRVQGGTCLLAVEDSGPGIPEAHMEHLFDPFFTTTESGMGLGLPIVQKLLEEYQGSIKAANRADGGAVFTVRLPLHGTGNPEAS